MSRANAAASVQLEMHTAVLEAQLELHVTLHAEVLVERERADRAMSVESFAPKFRYSLTS